MIRFALDDTIASLATPPGTGALAVIRVSGPEALIVGARVFRGERDLGAFQGFQATHGWIHDGSGPIDEVVAWVYRAPRSYTGEDMIELSCHGGSVSVSRVLEALWGAGARPAEPGEFTRRAFLHGRIDLAQAEAVADVIAARGRRAHEQALAQLQGGLSRRVRDLAGSIREVLMAIEAHLDFGEDVPEIPEAFVLASRLKETQIELVRLLTNRVPLHAREGCVIALVGAPNVGKSSLLNALVGRDRALVHDTPGTTRDVLDVVVEWSGIPVRLVDTAGLRDGGDSIERAGMERTYREAKAADLVLWVIDVSSTPPPDDEDVVDPALNPNRVRVVLNKCDLETEWKEWWVNSHYSMEGFLVSAMSGSGVSDLQHYLETLIANGQFTRSEPAWQTSERHIQLLFAAADDLSRAGQVLSEARNLELVAADLGRSLASLAAITGDEVGDDLLDAIFSRFCIGK